MAFTRLTDRWFGGAAHTAPEPAFIQGRLEGERILVPLITAEVPALTDQVQVATALARAGGSSLQVVNPITVPEQTPAGLSPHVPDEEDAELLEWVLAQNSPSELPIDGGMVYARRLVSGVLHAVATHDVDTVVLPRRSAGRSLTRETTEQIASRAQCDVVVVNGRPGFQAGPSILLPVAGGPHSGVAADVATRLAADADAWIDVLHVVEEDATDRRRDRAEEYVEAAYQRIARPETTTRWVLEADDPIDAIIEQSRYYAQTIVGAPTKGRLRRFLSGSTNRSIRSNARSGVLSVRNNVDFPDPSQE